MRKMMLASLVALAALMLAAAPAFAQVDGQVDGGEVTFCHMPGTPAEQTMTLPAEAYFGPGGHQGHGDPLGPCPGDNGNGGNGGDDDDDDNGDDDNNVINDRDRFNLRDVGNFEFAPSFEASQETEQECDSEGVDQDINVTGGGENSIQTVGLQPTANTGCVQNATSILDADPIFAAQGGDLAFNFDDTNVILDDDCDGNDDDGDGNRDEDGDCDGNDDGDNGNHNGNNGNHNGNDCEEIDSLVICDGNGNHNGDDNGDDNGDNVVDINDRDVFRFGGDDLRINGGGGGGDIDVEGGAELDVGGELSVVSDNTIEQNAAAASSTTVLTPKHWWWV